MTLNLTELRDEPLGKHPIQDMRYVFVCVLADSPARRCRCRRREQFHVRRRGPWRRGAGPAARVCCMCIVALGLHMAVAELAVHATRRQRSGSEAKPHLMHR